MKPEDFENFLNNIEFDDKPNLAHRDRLEQKLLSSLSNQFRQKTIPKWKLNSRILKFAAAAVVAIALLVPLSYGTSNIIKRLMAGSVDSDDYQGDFSLGMTGSDIHIELEVGNKEKDKIISARNIRFFIEDDELRGTLRCSVRCLPKYKWMTIIELLDAQDKKLASTEHVNENGGTEVDHYESFPCDIHFSLGSQSKASAAYGIFGDDWGSNLLAFLEVIKKSVAITFHTVLPKPDKKLDEIVNKLVAKADMAIVFTKRSKDILIQDYGVEENKIQIIPHGIHPVAFSDSVEAKASLNLPGRTILTSFGLLSDGKGVEYVIESLPEVVKKFPDVLYLVIGATHPLVLEKEGEKYRNFLIKKVYDLKLADHVRFYGKYLELDELLEFLKATDIYLSSSLNSNQAVSGTLSYALGTGRAIISTAFAQAKEVITPEVGILVDFKKPYEYTQALIKLLSYPVLRKEMEKNAYFNTRNMTWPNVALAYMRNFEKLASDLGVEEKYLPKIKLKHLIKLTDSFGMIQFAKMDEPDISSGYTLDDNARALICASLYYDKYKTPSVLKLINIYLNFVQFVSKPNGFFDDYINYDRTRNTERNIKEDMQDASARALYSVAVTATTKSIPRKLQEKAKKIFLNGLANDVNFTHLRSSAFYIKGLCLWLAKWRDSRAEASLIRHCDILVKAFEQYAKKDWQWFELHLTYSNSIIPEALLSAYSFVGENKSIYFNVGKTSLDFLISQTLKGDIYHPIGQKGWFPMGGARAIYDQQPEDASSMVQALKVMYQITGEKIYGKLMHRAFSWFLGDNILHQVVYDETTGGCNDGIGEKFVNLNQGAESTLSYLLARLMFIIDATIKPSASKRRLRH